MRSNATGTGMKETGNALLPASCSVRQNPSSWANSIPAGQRTQPRPGASLSRLRGHQTRSQRTGGARSHARGRLFWPPAKTGERQVGIGGGITPESLVLMGDQHAHRDPSSPAIPERADHRHIRTTRRIRALPQAGLAVASRRTDCAVEKGFDDPGITAHGTAAEAVAPPMFVLEIEDRSRRDDADTKRVVPTAAALGVVLADQRGLL